LPASAASLRLTLGPLDTDATGELVSSMLSMEQVSAAFASFVHSHTEGMPLAIEETIRLMADRADLARRNGRWARRSVNEIVVPASIRDAVLERAGRLDAVAQRVLHAAAVLASPADQTVLAAVCGLPAGPLHEGLSAALGTGLLQTDERGRVSFRHVLAARASYDAILAPDRRAMHLRAGQALRAATATPPAQLARHFREAGETATWCEYAERAAGLAVAYGDEATAMELLDDLMTTAGRPCLDSAARIFDTLTSVSLAEPARYLERLRRALLAVLAEQDLPPAERAAWQVRLALVMVTVDDWEGARAELELAIPHLEHDPARAARAMSLLAWRLDAASPASVNLRWLERAREVSARLPVSPAQRLRLLADRVACLLMLGEEAGWDEAATVPPDGDTPEERQLIVLAHANNGDQAMMWGRYAAAADWLARARELVMTHNYARQLANIDIMRAHLDWFTGAWEGLAERVRAPADVSVATPGADLEAGLVSGLLNAATGEVATAEQRFRLVLAEQLRRGRQAYAMEPGGALAWLCLGDGRAAEALEVTSQLAAIISAKGLWIYGADLIPAHVAALAATGRTEDAARFVAAFAAGAGGRDAPVARASLALSRALLAEAEADSNAGALFGAAAQAWQALPRPYDALLARERQARCLFAAGQAADARTLLGDVLRGLTELGATAGADRVARRLRDSGAQTRRPGAGRPGYGGRLSPRELDVVRLVADGQTNRQIAESLFLSPKTVASHVDAAMRKLNVSSRTGLAVAAVTAGIVTARTPLFIR
jgi:DNA-binding CsgD family transcriptional regulator